LALYDPFDIQITSNARIMDFRQRDITLDGIQFFTSYGKKCIDKNMQTQCSVSLYSFISPSEKIIQAGVGRRESYKTRLRLLRSQMSEWNVKPWLPGGRRHIGTVMMLIESSSTIRDFPVPDEFMMLVDLA
jgi:hypothetical protein